MVYEIVRLVPEGRVTTYGAIARCLGMSRSSRMVGVALKGCLHMENQVPAHRVVNRNGLLSGKASFGKGDEMAQLLRQEGIQVQEDRVLDFNAVFWDPYEEISFD